MHSISSELLYSIGKRINESARGIRSAMVENPIYEGPLYETLDTQFSNVNTISAATKNASIDYNYTTSREIPNSSNTSPTLRYVEQPCVTQNISHTHILPIEGHGSGAQCHTLQNSQQGSLQLVNLTAAVALDAEEKYMIMTQGNTAVMDMLNH